MIHEFIPFDQDLNIGRAYNYYCSLVPNDDDWILFRDADTQFLTSDYGKQLQDIVDRYPNTGLFTCLTNRVGNLHQVYGGKLSDDPNILNHKKIATRLQKDNYFDFIPYNKIISGHFMMFKKSTWNVCKFREEDGKMLGIDNNFSYKVLKNGMDIKILQGVYLFHYYRLAEGRLYKSHLKKEPVKVEVSR